MSSLKSVFCPRSWRQAIVV